MIETRLFFYFIFSFSIADKKPCYAVDIQGESGQPTRQSLELSTKDVHFWRWVQPGWNSTAALFDLWHIILLHVVSILFYHSIYICYYTMFWPFDTSMILVELILVFSRVTFQALQNHLMDDRRLPKQGNEWIIIRSRSHIRLHLVPRYTDLSNRLTTIDKARIYLES